MLLRLRLLLGRPSKLRIKLPPLRSKISMISKETQLNRKPEKLLRLGKLVEKPLKKREPLKLKSKSFYTQLIDKPPSLLGELKELPIKQPPLKLNVSIGSRKRSINKRPKLLKKPEKLPTKPS